MRVWIIGSSYVGLTTGCVFAYLGHEVTLLDTDQEKIEGLQGGRLPFHEKGLQEIYEGSAHRMTFTADWDDFTDGADVLLIAVGTPSQEDGQVDLSYLYRVAESIAERSDGQCPLILIKSTVPPGTAQEVKRIIEAKFARRGIARDVHVLSNPEFLREGEAVHDAFYPDRIIVGADHDQVLPIVERLYQPITEQTFQPPAVAPRPVDYQAPVLLTTSPTSAELIKYASNAFLATKISFINEFANLAEKTGADIREVAKGIGLDRRIGSSFLKAGIGWGGSCFGKDVKAMIYLGREMGADMKLVEATFSVNQKQRQNVIGKLQDMLYDCKNRTIGLLGLSFKPDTDDLRDAPALDLIQQLFQLGAWIKVYDPVAIPNCQKQFPDLPVEYCDSVEELFTDADAVVLVTEWPLFRELSYMRLGALMGQKKLIDARNYLDPDRLQAAGFAYQGIGHTVEPTGQRILVTGGAGFIGSHLVDQLLAEGYLVHVVDNMDAFYDRKQKEKNIAHHRYVSGYQFSELDICDREGLEKLFRAWKPEIVIHLAARAGVRPSVENPASYVQANIVGTTNLLDHSVQYGVKRFIFGSSSSVYGLNEKVPFAEGDPLLQAASPYAACKVAGEALCHSYANCYGLPTVALRFFTVYGPRQRPDLAIHTFTNKIFRNQPIQLFGDGTTSRDYTYVTDIVQGIRSAMEVELTGYDVFNLGNDKPTRLIDLVTLLEQQIGKKATIEWMPTQTGDVPTTWADLTKCREWLGYSPKISLDEGLSHFVHWYQTSKDHEHSYR
ncbi:nucleotide sugar dehydrogenase [Brevibacillus ginsengisoli]|uniref:nucleotide sugar dehydrogenase n=1 Tax=Brevibacillus ginsengisoli TaxID=363854 RepID=UPI003CF49E9E